MILRSTNGSGKTLSYLLPILNSLWKDRADIKDDISLRISKENEDHMFQNATQILYDQKKLKNYDIGPFKGAVVVSRSKELINQIYRQARLLDIQD